MTELRRSDSGFAEVNGTKLYYEIAGNGDIPDVLESADRLAARIKGATKVLIPDVAHMVSMAKPEEFNKIVLNFLKKQTPASWNFHEENRPPAKAGSSRPASSGSTFFRAWSN